MDLVGFCMVFCMVLTIDIFFLLPRWRVTGDQERRERTGCGRSIQIQLPAMVMMMMKTMTMTRTMMMLMMMMMKMVMIHPNPIACVSPMHRCCSLNESEYAADASTQLQHQLLRYRTVNFRAAPHHSLQDAFFFFRDIKWNVLTQQRLKDHNGVFEPVGNSILWEGCQIPYQDWAGQWWLGRRVQYLVLSSLADWVLSIDNQPCLLPPPSLGK